MLIHREKWEKDMHNDLLKYLRNGKPPKALIILYDSKDGPF